MELVVLTGTGVRVLGGDGFATVVGNLPVAHAVAVGDYEPGGTDELFLAMNLIEVWKAGGVTPLARFFAPGARVIALADIDADSRPDIVTAGRGRSIRARLTTNLFRAITGPLWAEALALRDIDGDGEFDLVVGAFGDANAIVRGVRTSNALTDDFGGLWTDGLALFDLERDGDHDIVARSREVDAPEVKRNE